MKIDVEQFNAAIEAIENQKGISKETVINALTEAMTRAYKRELGGEVSDMDSADVRVTFDVEKGIIDMKHVRKIVKDVQDDYLEITKEDAQAEIKEEEKKPKENRGKKYIDGDEFVEEPPLVFFKNATLMSIKSTMKQKFAEAERGILYEAFKDKIGTMITGRVETFDDRGASVNIGRTSVFLPHKEMIGDEKFNTGDPIKLFISDVGNTKNSHIAVSRASEGFLKALFAEDISEIYSGTIIIKAAARQAGERSKVAVYSSDPNVDPAGACIGPNGNRIQKIVGELGNGNNKEKVDVIAYSENPMIFVSEALKPAKVIGIAYDEEENECTAIVKDDSLSLAIGKKGVNVRLASKLTGIKIDVITETQAIEDEITYTTSEELESIALALKAQRISEAQKEAAAQRETVLPGLPEGYVAPQERVYENEKNDFDVALQEVSEEEEVAPAPVKEEPLPVVEEVKEEKEEVKEEPIAPVVEQTVVKTTTSLSDLEASLEAQSNKENNKKSFNKKKKKVEEEQEGAPVTKVDNGMSIYTEEELEAIKAEEEAEEEYEEDDIDYDEYDDYYDEDK